MAEILIYQVNAVYVALLVSIASFLISVFSLFYFKSYLKRRTGQERILSELRDEVNKILKSIDETTDRDISLIEEREKNLKLLLEDIEKRLKVYIREMEKRRESEDAYAALSRAVPPVMPDIKEAVSVSSGPLPPGQDDRTYHELGKNRYRMSGQLPSQTDNSAPMETAKNSPGTKPEDSFPLPNFKVKPEEASVQQPGETPAVGARIRELMKAGFASSVIASRLGISIAEVEFAAALLERREN